ncbi:MAG TPA: hypothetical protein VK072_04185 [Candidatus Avamphibacillus sp.]|nr:hypothetical protein [Candidatus Avamphibacillus sp.]
MHKENRLPQSPREGILFMLIISIISVNTIAPIIMMLDHGLIQHGQLFEYVTDYPFHMGHHRVTGNFGCRTDS